MKSYGLKLMVHVWDATDYTAEICHVRMSPLVTKYVVMMGDESVQGKIEGFVNKSVKVRADMIQKAPGRNEKVQDMDDMMI